jgi:hypothetical protein
VLWLVRLHSGLLQVLGRAVSVGVHTEPPVRCPNCGGPMRLIGSLPASHSAYFDSS